MSYHCPQRHLNFSFSCFVVAHDGEDEWILEVPRPPFLFRIFSKTYALATSSGAGGAAKENGKVGVVLKGAAHELRVGQYQKGTA